MSRVHPMPQQTSPSSPVASLPTATVQGRRVCDTLEEVREDLASSVYADTWVLLRLVQKYLDEPELTVGPACTACVYWPARNLVCTVHGGSRYQLDALTGAGPARNVCSAAGVVAWCLRAGGVESRDDVAVEVD